MIYIEARGRGTEAGLQEKTKEIQVLQERINRIEESHLKIIELLNNPNMVQHIWGNPQDFIAAMNTADAQKEYNDIVSRKQLINRHKYPHHSHNLTMDNVHICHKGQC